MPLSAAGNIFVGQTEAPLVGTGIEEVVARDSGAAIMALAPLRGRTDQASVNMSDTPSA